jgi:hypothetical protein
VHGVRLVSDNAGVIAFDLPELMGQETWFEVIGHGYGVKPDGFGYSGIRLRPEPGQRLQVKVTRQLPAQRLGRLTGTGLFAESQKLGEHLDWHDGSILGCDSIVTATFQKKLYWFWGDTNLAHYPLGIFNVSGATTENFVPPTQPPLAIEYHYFTASPSKQNPPRARGVVDIPGDGPTWLWGAIALPDAQGKEHLVGSVVKIKNGLTPYRWDLAEWNEAEAKFTSIAILWQQSPTTPHAPTVPEGHAVRWTDPNGKAWILFCNPFPILRCPATYEDWKNPATWEKLTSEKKATTPEGTTIAVHGGHIAWHPWSKKWLAIFSQKAGASSFLGEIWLAEAQTPTGPWVNARQVATHKNYSFYNPILHAEFFRDDSPLVYFEGTYVITFSSNQQPTPRWDYNQVLYQVDLSQPPFTH